MGKIGSRKIIIARKKRFWGFVLEYYVVVDNKIYAKVKNGKTVQFDVDCNMHELYLYGIFQGNDGKKMKIESNQVVIPEDKSMHTYYIDTKAGLVENKLMLFEA